jgi:beta-carotene 3-hydroxylase
MNVLLDILAILAAFFFMELVAWFTHKYIMHGFLWVLHKDHHMRNHPMVEWNDLFAIIFAAPSVFLIMKGATSLNLAFWIGIGIALYGLSYLLLHDSLVHQRLKFFRGTENNYFRAIISAHEDHHKGKKNYGFILLFPWKYFSRDHQKSYYNRQYNR